MLIFEVSDVFPVLHIESSLPLQFILSEKEQLVGIRTLAVTLTQYH